MVSVYRVLMLLALLGISQQGESQGFYTDFGKNRVQTKDYDWLFYRSNKFDVYYYKGGQDLARFVVLETDKHIEEIESFFDFRLDEKITFVLYNSKTDFNESNQFIEADQNNIGGTTRIIGKTTFIYFDENHPNFIENIRFGIASVVLNEMLYGGSVQERVQNSTLLNLPKWYTKGIISYVSTPWSSEMENRLRNGVLTGKFKKMASQTQEDKELISHSLWKYIEKEYGTEAVSNIVYVARINKSMESGFHFVLSKGLSELYAEWLEYQYYRLLDQEALFGEAGNETELPRRVTRKTTIPRFEISADGRYYALVSNSMGLVKVWIYDKQTGDLKKVHKTGYKSGEKEIDLSYPLIQWDLATTDLWIIDEKKGGPFLLEYSVESEKFIEKRPILRVQKIYSFDLSPDGRYGVFAGLNNGQSDVFLYDRRSGFVRPITNDDFNDRDPVFSLNGKNIIFSSNRTETVLKKSNIDRFEFSPTFDIYSYDFVNKSKEVVRLTYTDDVDETMPKPFDETYITYLGDHKFHNGLNVLRRSKHKSGVRAIKVKKNSLISANDTLILPDKVAYQKYLKNLTSEDSTNLSRIDTVTLWTDTAYTFGLSSFPFSILDYHINRMRTGYYYLGYDELKYRVYLDSLPSNLEEKPYKARTPIFGEESKNNSQKNDISDEPAPKAEESYDYYFETGFEDLKEGGISSDSLRRSLGVSERPTIDEKVFDYRNQASSYYLSFAPDEIITQFDNGFLQTPYLPYNASEPYIYTPALRSFFKLGTSDMFKDYRLIGGARLDINLRGLEYYVQYENLKNRLDKSVIYYRSSRKTNEGEFNVRRNITQELRGILKWPFNEMASLRLNGFVRQDVESLLSTNRSALERDPKQNVWLGSKLEYVYDNTIPDGLNLMYGMRYKLYVEPYFDIFKGQNMLIFGGDFRHYQKLVRTLTWCNRFSFGSSALGSSKVVYFMGGVEKWVSPQFEDDIAVDEEVNFAYKALAANMRGYPQNTRNGASFMVFNSELRWPFFRFFSNRPLKSKFLENFQAIGFFDAGTAFNGYSPFDENNAFDKRIIVTGPLRIEVSTLRDPIMAGYGFGFRSTVLGYYMRADWSWNTETAIEPRRVFYLSLGMDF